MRDLRGHTSRSLSTVEAYLDVASADSGPVNLADALAYYLAIAGALADTAAVVQRGRAAGAALGEHQWAAWRSALLDCFRLLSPARRPADSSVSVSRHRQRQRFRSKPVSKGPSGGATGRSQHACLRRWAGCLVRARGPNCGRW